MFYRVRNYGLATGLIVEKITVTEFQTGEKVTGWYYSPVVEKQTKIRYITGRNGIKMGQVDTIPEINLEPCHGHYNFSEIESNRVGGQRWSIYSWGPQVYLTCDATMAKLICHLLNEHHKKESK